MPYRRFFFFNILGGMLWAVGVTLAGYFLGETIPGIDRYFLLIVVVVIFLSALPSLIHIWKEYRHDIFAWVARRLSRATRAPALGASGAPIAEDVPDKPA
jgi:membrane-associated protein